MHLKYLCANCEEAVFVEVDPAPEEPLEFVRKLRRNDCAPWAQSKLTQEHQCFDDTFGVANLVGWGPEDSEEDAVGVTITVRLKDGAVFDLGRGDAVLVGEHMTLVLDIDSTEVAKRVR